ncbi:glycoside hydrolase 43 family protein [Gilvimarinus sp. SDUM040013]|uniref:Glycoside hydrolase 43 family protein n=1 Tax=Gilvimarinus gilvus TaxID=3058038 RepID=A0ABU4RVR4_9GAMM|nr:glycoside hydrolase 43 family protein [Gilvimarinus sp. SDUM040013]MDO3386818.1 glycoside hydrolase 43 family protein [Gilvimarinus sp. SDUM040013]MDX6848252.1 glycoside hydrolase 43 family protein [Gilvimarinus sp. SDUM040013]
MNTIKCVGLAVAALTSACSHHAEVATPPKTAVFAKNPIIWADVPDPAVIRVDDTYYMSSTTMHMNPGLPIMQSPNLVDWELSGYVYDTLSDGDQSTLSNGKQSYGQGSWASSLRYHQGRYYVTTFANHTGETYIFSTDNIAKGPWARAEIDELFHDASLFFDSGRAFLLYGNDDIHLVELTADATALKPNGLRITIIEKASAIAGENFWVPAEGAQVIKKEGYYYINLISWPANGMRTQLVYRAEQLTGPYQGRIALQDRGIAQGGLIDTTDDQWFAFLFRDSGAVGRIPHLVPVSWRHGWPVYGIDGKVPDTLDIVSQRPALGNIVESDEFVYGQRMATNHKPTLLKPAWQWNHNPDPQGWAVTERPGYLTLTNQRIDQGLLDTRNTLTQRMFGPTSRATVALDTSQLRTGDTAGLAALQAHYGFVGVEQTATGPELIMVSGQSNDTPEQKQVNDRVALAQSIVYLQIRADFRDLNDTATFWYSLDGADWSPIGTPLKMKYTLPHFMGYRFALFNYATQTPGGRADFDFYRIE